MREINLNFFQGRPNSKLLKQWFIIYIKKKNKKPKNTLKYDFLVLFSPDLFGKDNAVCL